MTILLRAGFPRLTQSHRRFSSINGIMVLYRQSILSSAPPVSKEAVRNSKSITSVQRTAKRFCDVLIGSRSISFLKWFAGSNRSLVDNRSGPFRYNSRSASSAPTSHIAAISSVAGSSVSSPPVLGRGVSSLALTGIPYHVPTSKRHTINATRFPSDPPTHLNTDRRGPVRRATSMGRRLVADWLVPMSIGSMATVLSMNDTGVVNRLRDLFMPSPTSSVVGSSVRVSSVNKDVRLLKEQNSSNSTTTTTANPVCADAQRVRCALDRLAQVAAMRADPTWSEIHPYTSSDVPAVCSFTREVLRRNDAVPVPPIVFRSAQRGEIVEFIYLGTSLCGYKDIVHGGMLATALDEAFARVCALHFEGRVIVTGELNLRFLKPCLADQTVVLHCRSGELTPPSRKLRVMGQIRSLDGEVLVEATAVFIAPKSPMSQKD